MTDSMEVYYDSEPRNYADRMHAVAWSAKRKLSSAPWVYLADRVTAFIKFIAMAIFWTVFSFALGSAAYVAYVWLS